MPTNPTYPGVYIEEKPSPVRSIAGVSTSRTAFIGRARMGPVNEPVGIKSFTDFERRFGGLWAESTMSYAVRQYFQNGGSEAIIVRLVNEDEDPATETRGAARATLGLPLSTATVRLQARAGMGADGNHLRITVAPPTDADGAGDPDRFDLVVNRPRAPPEHHRDLTLQSLGARLAAHSTLVEAPHAPPAGAHRLLRVSHHPLAGGHGEVAASAQLLDGAGHVVLTLQAVDPGEGGNDLMVRVGDATSNDPEQFNLEVIAADGTPTAYEDQTLDGITATLAADPLVRVRGTPGYGRPANAGRAPLAGGVDETRASITLLDGSGQATLVLEAQPGMGASGDDVRVRVQTATNNQADAFNLRIRPAGAPADGTGDTIHENLTSATVEGALEDAAALVRVRERPHSTRPADTSAVAALTGGVDETLATLGLDDEDGTTVLTLQAAPGLGARSNAVGITVLDAEDGDLNSFDLRVTGPDGVAVTHQNQDLAGVTATLAGTAGSPALVGSTLPMRRPANVGSTALTGGDDDTPASTDLPTDDIQASIPIEVVNEGTWGNRLRASVTRNVEGTFNLLVEELDEEGTVRRFETHDDLSAHPAHPRRVTKVLEDLSDMVRVTEGSGLTGQAPLAVRALGFSGGTDGPHLLDAHYQGSAQDKEGIYALEEADIFNLLCIPPPAPGGDTSQAVWEDALAYCKERRAVLLIDAPTTWRDPEDAMEGIRNGFSTLRDENAALYFPHVRAPDPLQDNRLETFAPSGAVAGVIARTDATRGFWKAPAGQEANLAGVRELTYKLTDPEHGDLNPLGVNCLRAFPVSGRVIWGARTTEGTDQPASQWKYLPVRRTALHIEESLYRGTQWVVFEPNDEPLWSQIRLNVGAFMHDLYRKGAFQGGSAKEAYFVKCDSETTTQDDIDRGIVNILVGFAPLKPAEFVIIQISQITNKEQ